MRGLLQDAAHFWRGVVKSPAFFAVAVLTLALGIGANTAIFSVINSVLLRPLPFRDPDRLVRLFETEAAPGRYPFAGPDYVDWKAQNRTLAGTSLYTYYIRRNVSGGGQPESALAVEAEENFFSVLGVQPLIGRTFARGESGGGGARVAVLSYGFWQRHFGGDPSIVRRRIELDARSYEVVGVMPSWFNYPKDTEIWNPLDMSAERLGRRGNHSFLAIGRLKPDASASRAQADLAVIAARLEKQFPDSNANIGASVVSLKEQLTSNSREPLLILLGAVALVLLVACANVANLLLIRAGARRRELAIRLAMGAGRWRIARQLLTESLLLALAGAAAGLAAAWWAVRLLRSVRTLPIPLANPVQIDLSVLLFALGTAAVTALLFGILPALQATRMSPAEELKSGTQGAPGSGGRGARRLRDVIAVAEIALSLALLVAAGLLLRSFDKMRHAEYGADAGTVLTAGVNLPAERYKDLPARRAFCEQLLERLRSSPGVRAAAMSVMIPLEGGSNGYITVPGREDGALKNQLFEWNYVTRDYFRTFGIPVVEGRTFSLQDEQEAVDVALKVAQVFSSPNPRLSELAGLSTPVVVNQTMARLAWPKQDPIGRTFLLGGAFTARVVGVVSDVKVRGIRGPDLPQGFFPFATALDGPGMRYVLVRAQGAPMAALPVVRSQVNALDGTLPLIRPRTMENVVADGMADTNLQTWLLGTFAALALVLAAVGLYSVMAFLVAQRRHEIGIRMALGAARRDLVALVLKHGTWITATGLLAGLAGALWLTRLLRGLLFGVTATDAYTFAAVSGLLAIVALVACALPARRAARVDPIVALRYE